MTETAASGTTLLVSVNGQVVPRAEAKVSVFDASFQSGDSVWEGLRVYNGRIFRLRQHLDRLAHSAAALGISSLPHETISRALAEVLAANGFRGDCHIRLMLSRGERRTSGMDPRNAEGGPTLVIIPELKPVSAEPEPQKLITASMRRPTPQFLDPSIHHSNQLNSILARLEAIRQGVDAALMLDVNGFVAEADSANIFAVIDGVVTTPARGSFLRGITRQCLIDLARELNGTVEERNIALAEIYGASEVFVCGTVCEVVPVAAIDGRDVSRHWADPPVWRRLLRAYRAMVERETR
ncbi:MAG: aminotransferase class IV [Acetobacteraceae bacterium]